ncbi:MAG: rod shape-determining protein MreD [Candidatus Brocadiae bacterium]|nr:rod shape-determining protein MreD [Candidatus Brocadiia bacterium]
MVRKVRFTICAAVLFVLQVTFVHRFSHRFLRPDLLYLLVIFLALEARFEGALWGAFLLGLLRDLGSCGRLGTSALLFVPATWGLLLLREHLLRESAWMDLILTFAYVLGCELVYALGVAAFAPGVQLAELMPLALGQAIFTTALGPLSFAGFARIGIVEPPSIRLRSA